MLICDKLSNENFEEYNELIKESKDKVRYQLDFYRQYDNGGFIYKYFLRKLVKLIKYKDKYIGYIWIENQSIKSTRINDIYIKEEFLSIIDKDVLGELKSNIVVYECYENNYNLSLVNSLNLTRYRITNLMFCELLNKVQCTFPQHISFKNYCKKDDRKLRCVIQNAVFRNESRVPLTLNDIEYDELQDYYINDLCIFILYNNNPIGYGQIVNNRGMYSIVNIGILDNYRGRGYGRALLYKLMSLAYEKGIKEIYIRVENTNVKARNLYRSLGFNDVGIISNWIWNR